MTTTRGRLSRTCAGLGARAAGHRGRQRVDRPEPLAPLVAVSLLLLALVLGAACTADDVKRPSEDPDAGPASETLESPELDPVPMRTPLDYVTVRGTSETAARIVSAGPHGLQITAVLPGGAFCQDIAIDEVEDNRLEFFALAGTGEVSTATAVTVAYDASAPEPAGGRCSGDGGGHYEENEICEGADDEKDDDGDGWTGECDLSCSGCEDDAYEPNDVAVNVPSLTPGTYDLSLCPCRDDWFAFHVAAGERIEASTAFTHAEIDIDMALYAVDADGGTGERVDHSATTGDAESIDYVAETAGTYFLRIYPYLAATKPSGDYSLTIPE